MSRLSQIARRLIALSARRRLARDLDDEMRLHLELRQQRLEADGLPAADAHTAARRQFGNRAIHAEDAADAWGWRWLDDIVLDVRYAARGFARQKAFTLTAIASLALGIGANAAIFSVVNGLVLRPLPFLEPHRLVSIYGASRLTPQRDSVLNLGEVRRAATSLEALAGYEAGGRYLQRDGRTQRVMSVRAEPDFFRILGVPPLAGRTFERGDEAVAVISEAFWRREFSADPGVVGRTFVIDERRLAVIGVMPDGFQFPYSSASLLPGTSLQARTDVWLPIDPAIAARGRFLHVVARLRDGVTLATAQAELRAIASRLPPPQGGGGPRGLLALPLADDVVGVALSRPLFFLLAAVGVVLALACANVANLLLVRMTLRHREVAVRAGLGASPMRLVRQFLAESLLLSLAGGAAGLALGGWTTRRVLALAAAQIPRAQEVSLDWRVFGFLFALSAFVGVLIGLAPAVIARRQDGRGALQSASDRSTMTHGQRRLRDVLAVAEIALAFVLAVAASLLVRELLQLRATDLGMVTDHVVTVHLGRRLPASEGGHPEDGFVRRFYEIEARAAALPGVRAAGATQMLPLQNWGWFSNSIDLFEVGGAPLAEVFPIELRYVTPGYFRALGIRVVRGRGFSGAETRATPAVIIVNEALARAQFGSADPVGRRMNRGTIIGVIADVRGVHPGRPPQPEIYFPAAQNWSELLELGMTLAVSTTGPPDAVVGAVRSIVHDVDPQFAVFEIKTMDRIVEDSLSLFRLFVGLIVGFAVVAVALALTGTYGVVSCVTTSRLREFAVRMALGADARRITATVVRHGTWLTAIGLAAGTLLVYVAAPLLRQSPISVRPPEGRLVILLAAGLAAITLAACLLPARRAARVDPMSVLRAD